MLSLASRTVFGASSARLFTRSMTTSGLSAPRFPLPNSKLLLGVCTYAAVTLGVASAAEKKHFGYLFRQLGEM